MKTRVFKMEIEPHQPSSPKKPCYECALASGPMCLDRSYCEFRKTGKTWKKTGKTLPETSKPKKNTPDFAYPTIEDAEQILGFKITNPAFQHGWAMARMTNKMIRELAKRSGGRMVEDKP